MDRFEHVILYELLPNFALSTPTKQHPVRNNDANAPLVFEGRLNHVTDKGIVPPCSWEECHARSDCRDRSRRDPAPTYRD